MKSKWIYIGLNLILINTANLHAEVYQWKDSSGRSHFSDQPVDDQGQSLTPNTSNTSPNKNHSPDHKMAQDDPAAAKITGGTQPSGESMPDAATVQPSEQKSTVTSTLQDSLQQKFKPDSAISRATLSVVAIETHMGSGSGFFISDQGHIITNKHVIRPMASKSSEENAQKLKDEADTLARAEAEIAQEKQELATYKTKLDDFARSLAGMTKGGARDLSQSDYDSYQKNYAKRLQKFQKYQQDYNTHKKNYDKIQSDLNMSNSLANVATQFKVFLKDNTKLSAKLLAISKKQDLALLQINGVKTIALNFYHQPLNQGMRVYAVGSPLGMRDAMTSGIITRLDANFVTTDAQILPGNSGGPLVTEEGLVIGVNTLKFAENVNGAGFGLAIPVSEIQKEFKSYLSSLAVSN